MSTIIQKKSEVPGRVPLPSQLEGGEIAINTHDGKMYFTRDKNGNITVREVGLADRTDNVLYVSKVGNDNDNNGTTLAEAFATLNKALEVATPGTTIFLKSGDHYLNNDAGGVDMPERVAIVGDNLRTTNIYPTTATNDMFYVKNACLFTGVTFRDYLAPSAAVSFNPDGSAGEIITSPYVQNCTSITTTGTGMRIDGAVVSGLRSMVSDAYTQINAGGIGIHLLNRGYAQLVSIFTVSCRDAILCENGGFCSLTNSNCSFGIRGLKATGTSEVLYTAVTADIGRTTTNIIKLKDASERPKYGDAVKFDTIDTYFTVEGCTNLFVEDQINTIVFPNTLATTTEERNAANQLLNNKEFISEQTIQFVEKQYPEIEYIIEKCKRDIRYIIDGLVHDLLYEGNFATRTVAASYFVGATSQLGTGETTATIAAYQFMRSLIGDVLLENAVGQDTSGDPATATEVTVTQGLLDIIIGVIQDGNLDNLPTIILPTFTGLNPTLIADYNTIQAEKANLQAAVIAFVDANGPVGYDSAKCSRDVGLIIDAITIDHVLGTNYNTIIAGAAYQRANANVVIDSQQQETVDALNYLRDQINLLAISTAGNTHVTSTIEKINSIIVDGDTVTLTLLESLDFDIPAELNVEFTQRSLIVASSITFDYIGTGTEIFYNTPRTGAFPIQENEVVQDENNAGQVYFTSTDHKGDFRIGGELTINRDAGIIEGTAFDRSLFAVLTPYILAIEG